MQRSWKLGCTQRQVYGTIRKKVERLLSLPFFVDPEELEKFDKVRAASHANMLAIVDGLPGMSIVERSDTPTQPRLRFKQSDLEATIG